MNTSRFLALALLAPLVAGCLTSSPQVSQTNEDRCAARGHKPDSKAFSDCIASIESVRERKMDARRNEMLERSNMPGRCRQPELSARNWRERSRDVASRWLLAALRGENRSLHTAVRQPGCS